MNDDNWTVGHDGDGDDNSFGFVGDGLWSIGKDLLFRRRVRPLFICGILTSLFCGLAIMFFAAIDHLSLTGLVVGIIGILLGMMMTAFNDCSDIQEGRISAWGDWWEGWGNNVVVSYLSLFGFGIFAILMVFYLIQINSPNTKLNSAPSQHASVSTTSSRSLAQTTKQKSVSHAVIAAPAKSASNKKSHASTTVHTKTSTLQIHHSHVQSETTF